MRLASRPERDGAGHRAVSDDPLERVGQQTAFVPMHCLHLQSVVRDVAGRLRCSSSGTGGVLSRQNRPGSAPVSAPPGRRRNRASAPRFRQSGPRRRRLRRRGIGCQGACHRVADQCRLARFQVERIDRDRAGRHVAIVQHERGSLFSSRSRNSSALTGHLARSQEITSNGTFTAPAGGRMLVSTPPTAPQPPGDRLQVGRQVAPSAA